MVRLTGKSVGYDRLHCLLMALAIFLILSPSLSGWTSEAYTIELSPDEQAWLDKRYTVRVRVGDAPPWEINTPAPQSMSVDYLTILGKQFGIAFKFIPGTEAWIDGFKDMAGDHVKYDLLPNAKRTEARLKSVAMSENYLHSPWVVFTRKETSGIYNIENLYERKIAVVRGCVMHRLLKEKMPEIELIVQESSESAVQALSTRKADAYIGNLIVTNYLIQRNGITNIKVACPTPFGDHSQAMVTRKEWAPLISIINKGLNNMPQSEKTAIQNRYVPVRFEHGIRRVDVYRWIVEVAGVLLFIISIMVFWNHRLNKEIKERQKVEEKLREGEERFALAMQGANDGLWDWNLETDSIYYSPRWKSMLGYSENEAEQTPDDWKALIHPDDLSQFSGLIEKYLAGSVDRFATEFRMRHKDGHYVDILSRASALRRDTDGKPIRIVGTHVDITERKRIETQISRLANEKSIILENTPIGIAFLKDRIFVWLNHNFAELFGYNMEEMQGASTRICYPSREAYEQFSEKVYPMLAKGETYRGDWLMKRKDGSLFWCHVSEEAVNPEDMSEGSIWMLEDISDQLKVEEYARQQAQIMDQIHDSVIAMTLDGMITSWNKGSENLFKYKSDEVIGRHIGLVYPDKSREWLQDEILPDILTHDFLEMETSLIPKYGQVFDALVSLSVRRDKNNEINGLIAYTIDITDRKQIERELQTSEAKFRALFDSAPIPLGYISNTGTLLDINTKFTQVFGYTRTDIPTADEWSKKAFPDPAYRMSVIEKRETALRKSRDKGIDIGPIEYQVTCKNGEVKQVFTSYTTLHDSFLAAFVDITDLRRAEESERRINTLYREINKISGEGINIAGLDGNYVSVNPAFCRMTGYSEAELLGMNVKDLMPSGVKMSLFPKVLRGEQGRREAELVRKDGSHFVAEIHGYPLSLENQKLAFANIRDITERIQAEEQIKASLKEKEVLLREIHHRVKNNLAVIISLLNLQAYQFKDEHIAAALQDSRDRVISMALIHETLYQSEDLAEISLKEYARNLGNRLLQAMKGKTGLIQMVYEIEDIRLDIDHAIPCGLILNELLTNALKYAFPENNGEVRIAAHYTETDEIELVVKDNGVGLPEGFDTTKLESLGLNIVWTLAVNQLEGTLDIRNENGARFAIRWPFPTNNREKNDD